MPVKPFADHYRLMARACAWEIGRAGSIPFSHMWTIPVAFPLPEGAIATVLVYSGPRIIEV